MPPVRLAIVLDLFPAQAGVILGVWCGFETWFTVPRAGGGDPATTNSATPATCLFPAQAGVIR